MITSDDEPQIPKKPGSDYKPFQKRGIGGHRSFKLTGGGGSLYSGKKKLSTLVFLVVAGLASLGLVWQFAFVVGESDRAMVETVEGQIKRALLADVSKRMMTGHQPSIIELEHSNPFDRYGGFSTRYAGPVPARGQKPPPGWWYFDARLLDIVYRVRDRDGFKTEGPFKDEVRFHVNLVYTDVNGNGWFDYGEDTPLSIELSPRYKFSWN